VLRTQILSLKESCLLCVDPSEKKEFRIGLNERGAVWEDGIQQGRGLTNRVERHVHVIRELMRLENTKEG